MLTSSGVGFNRLQDAIKGAIGFSVTFGTTLEEAGFAIARSMRGSSRELGGLIPEIRTLSVEQLKAGDAIEILAKKLGGAGAADRATFAGATAAAKNALTSFMETLGRFVLTKDVLLFLDSLANGFNKVSGAIGGGGQTVTGSV